MKSTRILFFTTFTLLALAMSVWAENPANGAAAAKETAPAPARPPITAADVQALKDAMAAQQQQIERLTLQLEHLQTGQSQQPSPDKTDTVQSQAVPQQLAEVSSVTVQQNPAPSSGLSVQETAPQSPPNPMESPVISIRFKGITITPG